MFARVAVPVPLGQAFSYAVPRELEQRLVRGSRVLCDFGRRTVLGVVIDLTSAEPDVPPDKLKPVRALVDDEPVIPEELLSFLLELARYYIAPVGDVMRLALPAVERAAADALEREGLFAKATVVGRLQHVVVRVPGIDAPKKLGAAARFVLAELELADGRPLAEFEARRPGARSAVKRLEREGIVRVERRPLARDPYFSEDVEPDQPPELNAAQRKAVDRIVGCIDSREPRRFLLDGVTASGKTEVYLRAIQRCMELGRGAIVLVPEIALTPQLVARFRARVGNAIAVLHSGLTPPDRHAMWRALRNGELKVAVGARSALFAPVPELALICVDEEHDPSFKQEEGVRYHARDMALLRAHRANAVCVLGSATPSLGSEALVQSGKLERLELPARARQTAVLPKVEIIDMRRVGAGPTGDPLISLPLHRALERTLAAKEQSILFLNRRGFSPSVICSECGHVASCPNCSVALTLHRMRGERMLCHYCEYSSKLPSSCEACRSERFEQEGSGTERIEALLSEGFPSARIARLDRDVAAGAKSERVLERMRKGEIDILVGTQMVTKGHDLPAVTLVGVLNADAALSMPDYLATERTFHLLVQVAGRAGRGDVPGTVMIQTRQPEHPAIVLASQHAVRSFVKHELEERRALRYPPYAHIALVRFDGLEEARVRTEAIRFARLAGTVVPEKAQILGPAPAPLGRLRSRYRYRFLVRAAERGPLRQVLLALARAAPDRNVRMSLDLDPVNML